MKCGWWQEHRLERRLAFLARPDHVSNMAGLLSMRNLLVCALLTLVAFPGVYTIAHANSMPAPPAKIEQPSVFVDGGVKNPGRYDWFKGMMLRDAIDEAGGLIQPRIDQITVRITRADGFQVVCKFNLGADSGNKRPPIPDGRFPLLRGDHVYVPSSPGTTPFVPLEPKAAN